MNVINEGAPSLSANKHWAVCGQPL